MVSANASIETMEKVWNVWWQTKKTKIPVRGTIYSNQLPQLSMQMSTNANTNVECNGKLTKYKHILCRFVQFHIFSFLADSQHIYCPFVQFSTFNIFLADCPHICHHLSHDLFLPWWGLSTTWPRHPRRSLPTLHLASFRIPSVWHHHINAHLFWAQSM